MAWINKDGLEVKFGVEEATDANLTAYNVLGPVQEIELLLKYSEFPALATSGIISEAFKLSSGSVIESVELVSPSTTFASALVTATLSVGIVDLDGASNASAAALVSAVTETELNTGGSNIAGWVGGAIGYGLVRPSLVTWVVGTEVFTSGESILRIRWSAPKVDADTLAWVKP